MNEFIGRSIVVGLFLSATLAGQASAAVAVFPAKGQSEKKQQDDEIYCKGWALNKTGGDPAYDAQPAPTGPQAGSGLRGGARGAAGGAAIGAIAGDAGKGAAIGGAVGAARGRRQSAAQSQQAAESAQTRKQSAYDNAFAACMEGKGYTVK